MLYSVESLVPIMMSQAYASLWDYTGAGRSLKLNFHQCVIEIFLVPGLGETYWVGTCFFVSAALTTIALTLSIIGCGR